MTAIKNTLNSFLQKRNDFCCLCLGNNIGDPIHIDDEVFVKLNDSEVKVQLSEVLSTVLGLEIVTYVVEFGHICNICTESAVNSYIFVNTVKLNSELLINTLNGMSNSLEYVSEEFNDCKSLYLLLNSEDFTSKHYYDHKRPVYNLPAASKRFNSLIDGNAKPVQDQLQVEVFSNRVQKECSIDNKSSKRSKCPIPTSEMLYDPNDSAIKCKECLRVYSTTINLRSHYIRVHAPKLYKYTECQKKIGSPAYTEAQKAERHCSLICSECGKTFNNKRTFKMHEMGHYMRIVCQDCGRVYKNKSTFKKHIEWNVCSQKTRASPADAKFTCDYCNKKYTQKVSLRVHIQYEHGNYKSHICKFCNKKFWAQSRLKAHMVKHTKEKNFACELCDGKFVTKEALLYHTRIHTGEKPYECSECNARFLSASRRSAHIKRHHTNATLECDICNSKFTTHNYLHKHRRGHFKNDNLGADSATKIAITEKVNEEAFQNFTQELKKIDAEQNKIDNQPNPDVYLEFTTEDDDYTIKILGM